MKNCEVVCPNAHNKKYQVEYTARARKIICPSCGEKLSLSKNNIIEHRDNKGNTVNALSVNEHLIFVE